MAALKLLAIAVATGRIGYVYFIGDALRDWGISRRASRSPALAAAKAQAWITTLKPDVVVSERPDTARHKGAQSKALMEVISKIAADAPVLDIAVERKRNFRNKYAEATELAKRYPELLPWLPRVRRLWEPEPRNMIYFEAMALAENIKKI